MYNRECVLYIEWVLLNIMGRFDIYSAVHYIAAAATCRVAFESIKRLQGEYGPVFFTALCQIILQQHSKHISSL